MDVPAFHDAHPGITTAAFARSGSYDHLAVRIPDTARVLDLACGDGYLLSRIRARSRVGLDLSAGELAAARVRLPDTSFVLGTASALPFAGAAFDAITCHLAFMLFDDLDRVVAELARTLAPAGAFHAVLGGGPTADGDDAFHRCLALAKPSPTHLAGDRRARSLEGWRSLFASGWSAPTFERLELDLGGTFDEVWTFLASNYQLAARDDLAALRAALARDCPEPRVPCRVVTWVATVIRR